MRYGSVCSGIEAASVAWHPLGWRPSFFSEIDPFPRAVLKHRFPNVPAHGDFTTIQSGDYDAIDLLVGGTPCQSFSVAGLRGGMADERGNLALEYLRLAQRLRPRWLVWENVPGVLSSNGGRDFGSILGGMGHVGYGFAYRVLDAQFVRVDGYPRAVPQRRRRVFVVGHLGDWRPAAAVLFERASLRWDTAPRRKTGKSAPTVPSRRTAGGGLGTDFDCDGGLVARCVTASQTRLDWETENFVPSVSPMLRVGGIQTGERETLIPTAQMVRRLTPRECERLQGFPDNWTLVPYRGKPAADGPRYKAIGNSMAVNCMRWIGARIDQVEQILSAKVAAE